jgi:hypothetical protein
MEELNIPYKLIALVKATMNNTGCRDKIQNSFSEPINVKNEVGQGDELPCLLFNIAYADDIDIIGRTQSAMMFHVALGSTQSPKLHKLYHCRCTARTPDDGQKDYPKRVQL